jgi:hypothetical protein
MLRATNFGTYIFRMRLGVFAVTRFSIWILLLSTIASAIPVPGLAGITPRTKWENWDSHVRLRLNECAEGLLGYGIIDAHPKRPTSYAIVVGKWQYWPLEEHTYWVEDEGQGNGHWTYIVDGNVPLKVATHSWHGDPARGDRLEIKYRTKDGHVHSPKVEHHQAIPATLSFAKCVPQQACEVEFWMETHESRLGRLPKSERIDDKGRGFPLRVLPHHGPRSTVVFDYQWGETSDFHPKRGGVMEVVYDPRRSADSLFKSFDPLLDWSTWAVVRFHKADGSVTKMRTRVVSATRTMSSLTEYEVKNRVTLFPVPENAVKTQLWFETVRNVQKDTRVIEDYDSDFGRDYWFDVQSVEPTPR